MTDFKIYAGIVIMILLLVMSFLIKDVMISELGAAFSLIIGANTYRQLTNQKTNKNESYQRIKTNRG
jgi:hypothetical protein